MGETVKLCWGRADSEALIRRVSSPTLLKLRSATRTPAKKKSPPLPANVRGLSLAHPGRAAALTKEVVIGKLELVF